MKAIINGKLILKDRVLEGKAILYSNKIEGICDSVPEEIEVIDAKGNYVLPGLIDIHIHGYLGKDVCDAKKESIEVIANGIMKNGVTSFLPTTMTIEKTKIESILEICRDLKEESKTWDGACVLGVHAEGPFISPKKKGAQDEKYILKPDSKFVLKYKDIIKIITMAPEEDEDFHEIEKIRKDSDIVISMGHTDADYETAIKSTYHGVRHATHTFNAMSPLNQRNPGVVGAIMNSDVTCELIVDTFHIHPALYDLVYKLKGDKLCFITDCLPAGGLGDGEYTLGGEKFISKGIECRLLDGTIAGSILKLNKGIYNVYKNSNIPLHECVKCATLNPARAIHVDNKKGSLEIGKDADIIIVDKEFNVLKTIIGGVLKYEA